tara:strand:+ start:29833 stop:29970 length:138 start_codon:yes stop_codon:yes gene_type:complete
MKHPSAPLIVADFVEQIFFNEEIEGSATGGFLGNARARLLRRPRI